MGALIGLRSSAAALAAAALAQPAWAQQAGPPQVAPLTVIAATPLPGTKLDVAKAPYDVRSLSAPDLALDGTADVTGTMAKRLGGVNVNENLDDPFQPDILYRGFEASPGLR